MRLSISCEVRTFSGRGLPGHEIARIPDFVPIITRTINHPLLSNAGGNYGDEFRPD